MRSRFKLTLAKKFEHPLVRLLVLDWRFSCLLLVGMLEAVAQPGPSGKVPPSLPPQASDKAKEMVQAKTAPAVSLTAPAAGALYTAPAAVVLPPWRMDS